MTPQRESLGVAHDAPDASAYGLAVLRWDDERAAAAVLARAFVDDPLVMAICDAPKRVRQERMRWGFRVAVRSHCLAAQPAWVAADQTGRLAAVVLVTRARTPTPASPDTFFAFRGLWHLGWRAGVRGARAAHIIARHVPSTPFTYLRTLGVDPAMHRQGLGSRLVDQVIRTATPTLPIYLETAKADNVAFYSRHGFKCIGEFPCLDVPIWRLWRPRAISVAASGR